MPHFLMTGFMNIIEEQILTSGSFIKLTDSLDKGNDGTLRIDESTDRAK
jgi:hypothetical protein